MNDLISVIIPVYNNEKYVQKCLESICANSYEKLEIIIVDDGSTDKSGQICDALAQKDFRIKVYHQENTGVSQSRNFGMSVAHGNYLAFIDSDDYIELDYFEKLIILMKQDTCDLVVGSIAHICNGKVFCNSLEDVDVNLINPSILDKKAFYELNKRFLLYGPVNKLYRHDLIIEKQIKFPIDTSYGEDLIFNFDYLLHCKNIVCREQPIYYYNHNNVGSLSHKYRENMFENGIRLNSKIKSFCEKRYFFTNEMEKFWAARVFDDAYNSLFDIWSNQCTLNIFEKYKKTKKIMNHPDVRVAVTINDYKEYSTFYRNLIRGRKTLIFAFVRLIKK